MPARWTRPASLRPGAGSTAIMRAPARASATSSRRIWAASRIWAVFLPIYAGAARRGSAAAPETQFRMRGGDVHYALPVEFLEAVNGAKKRVDMPDGKTLDIAIPAGVQDGQTLRLKGQGSSGLGRRPGRRCADHGNGAPASSLPARRQRYQVRAAHHLERGAFRRQRAGRDHHWAGEPQNPQAFQHAAASCACAARACRAK